jgi:dUTP pyrophosphatase
MEKIIIKIKKLENYAKIPKYMTNDSSGMDLYACISDSIVIKPMERKLIPTGISISLPTGYEAQIRPRSGLAIKHGITILNTPGTIDADYRGEIKIILINLSNKNFIVENGDRIAQMIINKVEKAEFHLVSELDTSSRGAGGFGSTGI